MAVLVDDTDTLSFNGPGTESTIDFPSFGDTVCTIVETATARATSVALACIGALPPG